MESLPTAKGFLIWIYFAIQATFYYSITHKPLDYKNNSSCMAVIKLLSKDLSEHRKPALLLGFQSFSIYSHSIVPTGFGVRSRSTRLIPGTSQVIRLVI